jgi:hypothetical protein
VKLGDHTIVLVAREPSGQRDAYGNDILTDVFTEHPWCLVTPTLMQEPAERTRARISGLQLLAPAGVPIAAADAVIWPPTATGDPAAPFTGPRYEVDGDVGDWGDFLEARLTRRA